MGDGERREGVSEIGEGGTDGGRREVGGSVRNRESEREGGSE